MSFTVIIPFYNGHAYLPKLLASIPETIPVIIVDDQSDKPPYVSRPNAKVIVRPHKGYFTGAVNTGLEACKTDVLVLNQDAYFENDDWLNFIKQHRRKYGLFGEQAGSHPAWPNRYVHGTFMYVRRDVIRKIGLLDAVNYPHWGSTCEYQLRACRNGFKTLPVEEVPGFVHLRSRQEHFGSATKQALAAGGKKGLLIRTPPQISIIISCYNYGEYLRDTINSLIGGKTSLGQTTGQTRQDFEIIIVDDGSTDNSLEVIERLADPWQGIHYVSQRNQGSAVAANTGIEASHARSGHFIAMLDADDMMKPERLARMMRAYEANPHSLIYDNLQYFAYGQEGVVVDWQTGKRYDVLDLGSYNFEEVLYKNTMHKGLLYPRQAWEEVGGYPAIMNKGREDWAFNVGAGVLGWCGVNTGFADYLYRREGQNRTLRNTTPKWRKSFLKQIQSIYPSIYAGERPMGCCTGRKSTTSKGKDKPIGKLDLPGKKGMMILEYIGQSAGDQTWRGPITRTKYVLGGVRKKGYVDIQDAHGDKAKGITGMLAIDEGGHRVFKEHKPKRVQPSIPKVIVANHTDAVAELVPLSVSALRDRLPSLSPGELEAALQQERKGRGRTTALKAIEEALDERLA